MNVQNEARDRKWCEMSYPRYSNMENEPKLRPVFG
jgi:hypothetical protein